MRKFGRNIGHTEFESHSGKYTQRMVGNRYGIREVRVAWDSLISRIVIWVI